MSRSPEVRSVLAELERDPDEVKEGEVVTSAASASVDAAVTVILAVKKIKKELHKQ